MNQLSLQTSSSLKSWQTLWPQLANLLAANPSLAQQEFSHFTPDSRLVKEGSVFFALTGSNAKGEDFIPQAVEQGASLVVVEAEEISLEQQTANCWQLSLPNLSNQLGELLALISQVNLNQLETFAITGTNGKSSVAHYICQLLEASHTPAVLIGTLGTGRLTNLASNNLTTPGLFAMYDLASHWQQQGVNTLVLEASSHALHQNRLAGLPLNTGVFTNLSHDHLDYHHTLENYAAAKFLLFQRPELTLACLNLQEATSQAWLEKLYSTSKQLANLKIIGFCQGDLPEGVNSLPNLEVLQAQQIEFSPQGISCQLHWQGKSYSLTTPLLGAFNLENLLATLSALLGQGQAKGCEKNNKRTLDELLPLVAQLKAPTGRMQQLAKLPHQPQVVVDFAHTPAALENLLTTLKAHCQGRLISILGCGGDRDASKRAPMGKIAAQHSQLVIITDDNPRHENPAAIRQQVLAGAKQVANPEVEILEIGDRKKAIAKAIQLAQPQDWVVIAGKGHETYQEIAGQKYEFSDVKVANELLQEI